MQTTHKTFLPTWRDKHGGFRCVVDGKVSVLPPSEFPCKSNFRKQWAGDNAGKEFEVAFTGKTVPTELGDLPVVSIPLVRKLQREELARRYDEFVALKYGKPTSATVISSETHYISLAVNGRKAYPRRDAFRVSLMRDQVGHELFDKLSARIQSGKKIRVVLKPSRAEDGRLFFECALPNK